MSLIKVSKSKQQNIYEVIDPHEFNLQDDIIFLMH